MITLADSLRFFDNFNVSLFEQFKRAKQYRSEKTTKKLSVKTVYYESK